MMWRRREEGKKKKEEEEGELDVKEEEEKEKKAKRGNGRRHKEEKFQSLGVNVKCLDDSRAHSLSTSLLSFGCHSFSLVFTGA